jgi:hypothetical protein
MFLRDLISSKIIVIPTIIFTIACQWEEVLILRITNKTKLLVLFHGILVYTRNSVNIFQIPGGKYINDIFSDGILLVNVYKLEVCGPCEPLVSDARTDRMTRTARKFESRNVLPTGTFPTPSHP